MHFLLAHGAVDFSVPLPQTTWALRQDESTSDFLTLGRITVRSSAILHMEIADGAIPEKEAVRCPASTRSRMPRSKSGVNATIGIKHAAGAACTITVFYKSDPSRARGLGPKTADTQGKVSWTWRVGTTTTLGTWPIVGKMLRREPARDLQTSFVVQSSSR